MRIDFTKYKDFISFPAPIKFNKFRAIGYFPYEKAQITNDVVCVPRTVFTELIAKVDIMDNKYVIVFQDEERFGTQNFALQVKDSFCKIGSWEQVVGYALRELK